MGMLFKSLHVTVVLQVGPVVIAGFFGLDHFADVCGWP